MPDARNVDDMRMLDLTMPSFFTDMADGEHRDSRAWEHGGSISSQSSVPYQPTAVFVYMVPNG